MGSYKQHVDWGKNTLILLLMYFVWLMATATERQLYYMFGSSSSKGIAMGITAAVVAFLVGNVAPDIDHDTSTVTKRVRKMMPLLRLRLWRDNVEHWGHWHSVFAAVFLSELLVLGLLLLTGSLLSLLVGLMFGTGYCLHLFCDQVYHETRGKKWKKKALKWW